MIDSVHILLTYACTFECDHCFLWCSPRAKGTFTLARLEDALDQIGELDGVSSVYFEGGEPFLFHPLLVEAVRLARARGLTVGLVTNAYWATGIEDARLWLAPLAALGIDDLSLSEDSFHGSDESAHTASNARAAADALSIPTATICIERPGTLVEGPDRGAPVEGGGPMMRGRAVDTLAEGLPRHPAASFTECPHEELRTPERVHLDPYGNIHLCQGLLMGTTDTTRRLRDVVEAYDPDTHAVAGPLLAGGPLELARRYAVAVDPAGYVDACHLCYLTRKALLPRLPEVLGPAQVYGVE